MGEKKGFKVGDRVRLNNLGLARSPRIRERGSKCGMIVGKSITMGYRVVLDGSRYSLSLHASYLELEGSSLQEF